MADEVKQLLVRVSATTELLRSQLIAAERQVTSFEQTTTAATTRVNNALQKTGYSAAAQQAGIKQLGQQFGDLSLQLGSAASSAKPAQMALMAFAQQGGQIAQALDLASGGTSKFAAFLGGPWGIAITAGAAALGPLIQSLLDTALSADKATGALDELIKKRRQERAEKNKVSDATTDLNGLRARRSQLQERIRLVGRVGPNGQMMNVYREQKELADVNAQIAEGENAINDERDRRWGQITRGLSLYDVLKKDDPKKPRVGRTRAARTPANPLSTSYIDNLESDNSRELSRAMEERIKMLNEANADQWKAQSDAIRRQADYEYDQREAVLEKLQGIEQAKLGTLSNLYEDLFRGGTKAIWDDFGQIGQRVIARVLAQFTLSRFQKGGGGFDLGGAIGDAFGAVLGFRAAGGPVSMNAPYIVGERGPELFVPDVAGTIVPNHALGGGGPSIVINAPGATAETVSMIRREIAQAAPLIAAAATGQTARTLNRRTL